MTTAREPSAARRSLSEDQRSLLPGRAGMRSWAAVCLALGLTAAGAFVDILRLDRLGILFQACYFLGCLLAVIMVQHKGLFLPIVQPPLVLTLAVPSVVLLAGSVPTGKSTTSTAIAIGTPLINGFPTMAITTVATLAVGAFRLLTQRRPATRGARGSGGKAKPDAEPAAEPVARPVRNRTAEQARRQPTEQAVGRLPARRVREPDAEPITEPVAKVTDRAGRRRRRS